MVPHTKRILFHLHLQLSFKVEQIGQSAVLATFQMMTVIQIPILGQTHLDYPWPILSCTRVHVFLPFPLLTMLFVWEMEITL